LLLLLFPLLGELETSGSGLGERSSWLPGNQGSLQTSNYAVIQQELPPESTTNSE
jgi:hypothetical protein